MCNRSLVPCTSCKVDLPCISVYARGTDRKRGRFVFRLASAFCTAAPLRMVERRSSNQCAPIGDGVFRPRWTQDRLEGSEMQRHWEVAIPLCLRRKKDPPFRRQVRACSLQRYLQGSQI